MKADKHDNKRKAVRVPVNIDTKISHQEQKYEGGALNLSIDGMFIHTAQSFAEQDRILVFFQLPNTREPMRLNATVMWGRTVQKEGTSTFGMGIRFEQAQPAQKKELIKYIQSLLKT